MTGNNDYDTALAIARRAHDGDIDKGGAPYITHPVRVAANFERGSPESIAGLLHDVVEDSDITLEDLRVAGIDEAVIDAVACLTKQDGQDYDSYLAGVEANPIARAVKIADITDNMDLSRIPDPTPKDFARLEKYRRALARLKNA